MTHVAEIQQMNVIRARLDRLLFHFGEMNFSQSPALLQLFQRAFSALSN
jgi:hypothetical protein